MLKPYTYILINFLTIIVCFIASFDKRVLFYKHFRTFLLSSSIVAIPFIIWDAWFTRMGVWWFDANYVTGIFIIGLPIEEILFFWCIPFACVFTYYCFDKFFNLDRANTFNNLIIFTSSIILVVIALLYYQKTYTFVTALVTLSTMLFLHFIAKKEWIGQASFVYLVILPGFLVVNGILTGTGLDSPIVNYNSNEFLNIRIFTIPIEDAVYGYSIFLLNIYFFKTLQNKINYEK